MGLHFICEKTQRRYDVVSFNKETGEVVLKGKNGGQFIEKFDKDKFLRMGYVLQQD